MPTAEEQKIWKSWSLPQQFFSLNYFFMSGTHKGRERRFQNEDGNIRVVTKLASQCTLHLHVHFLSEIKKLKKINIHK